MRRKRSFLLPLISILFCLSAISQAQLWSGVISSSRAVDWTQAGIPGGIPDASWTQCGSTIAAYSGTAATINSAISSCAANHYVLLGAGTFSLSSAVILGTSNVVLRGQGANSTFIVFTGGKAGGGCYNSAIAIDGNCQWPGGGEGNVCNFTGGYGQGSTTITVANCGSTTPAMGSLSNLKVGSILILDQVDEAADTGTIWNCSTENVCANTVQGGEERTNGPCVSSICLRSQQQGVVVTGISGSNITISPGLYMPNWRAGQAPQAWFASTILSNTGVENLAFDATKAGATSTIELLGCNGCWIKGVRGTYANRSHVRFLFSVHSVLRDSYFFANQTGASVSYGAEIMGGWNNLIENNIFQQDTDSEPSCTGGCAGNVVDYNFDINNVYTATTGFMQSGFYLHAAGDVFNLFEGNIGPGYNSDSIHGTHHFETVFRNQLLGQNQTLCNGTPCVLNTIPITLAAGSRYLNIIGNVLGTAGYHNNYNCIVTSSECSKPVTSIYALQQTSENSGQPNSSLAAFCLSPNCSSTGDYDPQVTSYLFRWGNWDVVNAASQFNSSEVPSGIALYPNPVPSSHALPASFYYSSAPGWWPSGKAWPAIGPDVSGGNLLICTSGTYSGGYVTSSSQCGGGSSAVAVAGLVNSNPAMDCYLGTMGGAPNGTGSVLSFNAGSCYGSDPPPPAPPKDLTAVVH